MTQARVDTQDVSVRDLIQEVAKSWRLILLISGALAVVGALLGVLRPREYQTSILMAPASQQAGGGGGGLAALASRYSGVAALAGISVGSGQDSEETIAVLKSRQIASRFIGSNDLLPVLYAKDWDAVNKRWTTERPRSLWEASERFRKEILYVTYDGKTGLVQLTVTWTDPVKAAEWANGIVRMTNDFLRDRAIAESEKSIAYLTAEAQKATLVDTRQAIFEVMRDEINRQMMARGRNEFALRVLDPGVVPERPSSPGPITLFVLLGAGGAFLSVLYVLGRKVLQV